MPLLALLTGPAGRIAGVAVLAVALLTAGALALNQHDARVRAEQTVAAQAAEIATMQADHARAVAALEAQAAAAQTRAKRLASIRSAVDAAPLSSACSASAAVRAVLDGLRQHAIAPPLTRSKPRCRPHC